DDDVRCKRGGTAIDAFQLAQHFFRKNRNDFIETHHHVFGIADRSHLTTFDDRIPVRPDCLDEPNHAVADGGDCLAGRKQLLDDLLKRLTVREVPYRGRHTYQLYAAEPARIDLVAPLAVIKQALRLLILHEAFAGVADPIAFKAHRIER